MGSDGIIKWSENFKSSADAAKAWGISVEAAEVAMRNLESYGAEFDGITFNAEELDNYKASLDGIKSIYDSMEDGAEKDRLGSLIEGWDAEYAKYEQDISTLSEDQVVKIKFEYDLAELQQKIQEARDAAESSDSNSDWAKVVAGQKQERSKLESQTGYTKESDSGYAASYDKLDSLRKERNKASGDAKTEITKEMSAIGDLQNAFQQFRLEGGNLNWEDYLKSDQATATLQDIMDSTQLTEEQIASLFGMKPEDMTFDIDADDSKAKDKMAGVLSNDGKTITMNVDASTEEIQAQINQLQAGQTLLFQAEVDGEPKGIEAIKRQDGTIAYTVEDNGVQYYLEEVRNEDGTISYTLGDYPKEVPPTDQEVYRHPDNSEVSQDAPGVGQTVKRTPDNSGIMSNPPAVYQTVIRTATNVSSGIVSAGKNAASQIKANLKQRASGTLLSPAHAYGTARQLATQDLLAPAYADGKVSLPNDEYALVNELGTESRIRNGVWSLLPPGMHMENLKKGDIILNAKQTSDLLKSGKTTGTARAYASGSLLAPAYASGMLSLGGNYGSSYGKSYGSTTTKSTKAKSSTNTVSQAAQAATQAVEDSFDFVKIFLDRTKETTEKFTDAIDDAVGLADKMSKNSSALSQIQNEISVNQQAYQKYMAQANAVGLAEGYASQIRNGSLNIENITDENLKKKIDDYQEWYEKAKDCQEAIDDLQKDEKELAQDRLTYIEDYYDSIIKLNDAYKDVNDARLDYLEKLGSSAITDDIKGYYQNSYAKEYDSYGKALQQLADYTQEVNELLANGYLQEGSEDYLEAMKTIQEFTKQVDESATALIELEDKIREIDYTRLQQLIDGSDRRTDQLKNAQSLAEARDEQIVRDEYQKQVDELSKSINANYALREAKIQEQNLYDVTSTRYQELAEEISKIDGEIYGSLEDIEDLKNKIFEAEFFNFDKEQENLEYFIGELDDFAKLLNSDAYFDKTGAFTDEAYAKISLTADAMSKCKQATANATEALKKLDEMYQNGLISESEFTERQRDLLDTIRDSVSATEDYKQELLDLYTEQIEKENDALKESISLRQKALKSQKEYWDYADSIKSKTKDVDALKSQIAALEGVTSASAIATKKKLEAELADAEKELADTKRDHAYDLMDEGYSTMSDNLDKSLEDIDYSISHSTEKQLQVVQSMLSQMVGSYSDAFNKISSIISNTGFVGTGSFNNTVSNVGSSTGSSSIASGATQDQSTIKPSDSASNINSDNIQNGEHGAIETEIKKEPNTDNRLCAELKISATSVSVQEGSQTSITASIRPNDAKNKTLSWSSADPSIASVSSEGKVTGVKPGNTTITVSTTDGSGLMQTCKVTVTKKPDPPKPTPPVQPSSPQGNGVPDVGDKVTFVSGIYHEDSYGGGRWGNWELGGSVYITKINPGAPYPIHISKGNRLGSSDRGWLRLDQLRGYRNGSRRINGNQWAWTQEDNKEEVIFRASDGAMLTPLNDKDMVFNNEQVQNLWEMSKGLDMSRFINLNTSNMIGSLPNIVNRNEMNQNIYIGDNMDSLFTIEGNVTKDAIPGLEKTIRKMIPEISDRLGIYIRSELKR